MERVGKFGLLGAGVTLTNLALFAVAEQLLGLHYLWALLLATAGAIIVGFLGNELWVFRGTPNGRARRLLINGAYGVGEGLARVPLLWGLVEGLQLSPLLGQLVLTAVLVLVKFMFFDRIVYRSEANSSS